MADLSASALAIILAAERLFGEHGIDGVSMRQISAASGNGNVSAVQYHFTDKSGIITAILAHRRSYLDGVRREMAQRCFGSTGNLSLEEALYVSYCPLFAQRDSLGNRSYARFLQSLFKFDLKTELVFAEPNSPYTGEVHDQIRGILSWLDEPVWNFRIRAAARWSISAVADFDRGSMPGYSEAEVLAQIVMMASAALRAEPTTDMDFIGAPEWLAPRTLD